MQPTTYHSSKAIPLPLAERPSGDSTILPCGQPTVKAFDKLSAPVQELVLSGGQSVGTAKLTQQPLTRTELERERSCLEREAATIERRLKQVYEELLNLPTAA